MVTAEPGQGAAQAGELCADTLQEIASLELHLQFSRDLPEDLAPGVWLEASDLLEPEHGPLAHLLARFGSGFNGNRRVAAASLLLRFGWASGLTIASYLVCRRVPFLDDYALLFSPQGLLQRLDIRATRFYGFREDRLAGGAGWVAPAVKSAQAPDAASWLRERLLESLLEFSEPLVDSQHRWSRFSRHALWSMVTSSWGAQFTSVARQLGDAAWGIREAEATLALNAELARAAPRLYEVAVDEAACTCQRRAACCLYFKAPNRPLCASCPLLSESERLSRNRQWIRAQRPVVSA